MYFPFVKEQRPVPELGPGEVQLSVHAVGICGTDVVSAVIMGHEPSGAVSKVGDGVTTLSVGMTKELPDHVSFEEGAMLQPLAVAVHACERADIKLGAQVLICGAGPIRILCMLTARARGAETIILTNIERGRFNYASELGANKTVLAGDPQQTADLIKDRLGDQADVTIECSGAPASVSTAMLATSSGGRIVQVGYGPAQMELPYMMAAGREVDILGMTTIVNNYPTAVSMVATGQVNVKQLITHRFKLEESMDVNCVRE